MHIMSLEVLLLLYTDCGNVEIKVNPSYGNLRQLQTQTAAFLLSGADSEGILILE